MSLCGQEEAYRREARRQKRLRHAGYGTPAMEAHDAEQAWRAAGEWEIRAEMERRVAEWLKRRGGSAPSAQTKD